MAQTCPLLFRSVDGTIARINSFSIGILVILTLLSGSSILMFLLSIDFLIRIYGNKSLSPIYQSSKIVKKILNLESEMVDAGAKRLAALFGFIFSALLFLAVFFSLTTVSYILAAVFLTCIFLELAFSYCVGCQVYFIIKKIYPSFMEI